MIFKYITAASLIIAIGSSFIIRSKNSEIESLEKDISLKNSEIIILETDRNSLKSAIAEVNESIQKQNMILLLESTHILSKNFGTTMMLTRKGLSARQHHLPEEVHTFKFSEESTPKDLFKILVITHMLI